MSTLKTNALQGLASAIPNVALNADGTSTFAVFSGTGAPPITTTGALWLDTTNSTAPTLKVYNGPSSAWITPPGGAVPPSPTPPVSPVTGDIYYDTSTTPGVLKVYNGSAFVPVSTTPSSNTAPTNPQSGTTWYDTTSTPPAMKVWNGSAWVPVGNNQSGTAPTSPTTGQQWTDTSTNPPVVKLWNGSAWIPATVAISNGVAPTSPVTGQLWSDTSTTPATLKAWNGSAWVPVQAAGGGGSGTVTSVSGTAPIVVATGTTTPAISITAATTGALGAVQVGTNVDVAAGVISVKDASATDKGVIEIATLAEAATGTSALLASTPSTAVPKTPADMTGAALIPGGNDAARPSPVAGMLRYNNQAGTPVVLEYYNGSAWAPVGSNAGFGLNLTGSNLKVAISSSTNAPAVGTALNQAITGSLYWDDTLGALFYRYINTSGAGGATWVQAVPSGGGGSLAGATNILINGNFAINQRSYVSGTATTGAGEYTLDRWKVLVSGQNLAFAASGNGNQITAPAGGVQQVIEAGNVAGGTYTLSWTGTATADVNGSTVANGAQVTLPANTQATVTFTSGTVEEAQLELGTTATAFEQRLIGTELSLCQRYFERGITPVGSTYSVSIGVAYLMTCPYATTKRATPTVTITNLSSNIGSVFSAFSSVSLTQFAITSNSAGTASVGFNYLASAEL